MNTDTTDPTAAENPNDPGQDTSPTGPGRLIRLGRERARLGLTELASLIKLSPATLDALERDDFAVLNEPVYVRGYYRKCAKALGLPEQELLAAYEKVVSPRAPQAPTKLLLGGSETGSSLKKTRRRSASSSWWVWVVGFVLLLAVAAWFMREDPNSRHAALSEGPAAAKPLSEAPSTEEAPAPAGAADAPAKSPSTNELATTPQDSGESAGASASTAKPAAAPAPVQPTLATELSAPPVGDLTLDFKAPSWARVEDSTGKLLLSGVIPSGAHEVLGGKAPYSVFLGNAPGVSVQYQGHPFNVSSFVKSNDTARFSVPGAGG